MGIFSFILHFATERRFWGVKSFVTAFLALLVAVPELSGRTLIVAPTGIDSATGSAEAPLRTITKAAELAQPGDTILVRAGVYRERVTPPRSGEASRPITYRAEKLGTVFLRGSDIWKPQWKAGAAGVFSAVPHAEMFNDDVYLDDANPFRVELSSTPYGRAGKPELERFGKGDADVAYTCGQVIINGQVWKQRPKLGEIETRPGTWHYEAAAGRIHVHFGDLRPAEQQVEISTRRRIFAPHVWGLGHIVIEGFVMEHCGNQYPTNFWNTPKWAQAGALGFRGGHHWIVRHNIIRHVNAMAMDIGFGGGDNEREPRKINGVAMSADNLIENNYILDNGAAGIVGAQSDRMVIRGNVIQRNNTLGFTGVKRYEHAGLKFHQIRNGLIERNFVADNPLGEGIWLDNQFPNTRVTRNVVVGNGHRGIFLEMSDYQWDGGALVDHNISMGNANAQFYVHDASGSTVMHNLFANSAPEAKYGQGAYIYQVNARTKTGYHSLFNNLFLNHPVMLDINYPAHRSGPQRLDHNVYDVDPAARSFVINSAADKPSPWSPEAFLALVRKDVGKDSPQPVKGGAKVALTLGEWSEFWAAHGQQNDRHSLARIGVTASYDPATLQVTVDVPFDLSAVGSTPHAGMDRDFSEAPVPQDGKALPGPFQSLKKGKNTFKVWNGLPLLGPGGLPE